LLKISEKKEINKRLKTHDQRQKINQYRKPLISFTAEKEVKEVTQRKSVIRYKNAPGNLPEHNTISG
jgi:phosphoribosyl-dephospho-CoA transferase